MGAQKKGEPKLETTTTTTITIEVQGLYLFNILTEPSKTVVCKKTYFQLMSSVVRCFLYINSLELFQGH